MANNHTITRRNRGRTQKRGPLRAITEAIRFEPGLKTRVYVQLECGHTTWTTEGAQKARCESCAAPKE